MMEMGLEFFKEECGVEVIYLKDNGFITYKYSNDIKEMFVDRIYIAKEKRSMGNMMMFKEVIDKTAKDLGAETLTGIVKFEPSTPDRFMKKLKFYDYLGFKVINVINETVVIYKEA